MPAFAGRTVFRYRSWLPSFFRRWKRASAVWHKPTEMFGNFRVGDKLTVRRVISVSTTTAVESVR
jgi:hypothetical protein